MMIDTILVAFFSDLLVAAAVWSVLLVFAIVAIAALIGRRPKAAFAGHDTRANGAVLKRVRLAAKAAELNRHAREVTVAAERAGALAHRRREEWLAAQERVEAAWQAYQAGDGAARRLNAAAALPTPRTPSTPAEYADRERYLHRAAMAACSRRELSALDLSDALAHRNGWDARLHPADQEVVLRRFVAETLLANYRQAIAREQETWQAAGIAAAAARSLREEAFAAADGAQSTLELGPVITPAPAYAAAITTVTMRLPLVRIGRV